MDYRQLKAAANSKRNILMLRNSTNPNYNYYDLKDLCDYIDYTVAAAIKAHDQQAKVEIDEASFNQVKNQIQDLFADLPIQR